VLSYPFNPTPDDFVLFAAKIHINKGYDHAIAAAWGTGKRFLMIGENMAGHDLPPNIEYLPEIADNALFWSYLSRAAVLLWTGRIDDSSALGDQPTQLPVGGITIDTGGVTFVNSIGMREAMELIRALRERAALIHERVADVLMTKRNMISEHATSVEITSFHAQYVCSACGQESATLVDVGAHAETLKTMTAPKLPCPECGAAMDLGDFPERYLSIFRNR
jgi:DNA-directed RNA polymerase subunit RPC12/RpoP